MLSAGHRGPMLLGAHVSTAGGIDTAVERGTELGCDAIQIFPQSWLHCVAPELGAALDRRVDAAGRGDVRAQQHRATIDHG